MESPRGSTTASADVGGEHGAAAATTLPSPRTPVVPPYWQHSRQASRASVISYGKPTPITLEDNSAPPDDVTSPLWARAVVIDSHAVVSGSVKGVGDYVVWTCRVQTLDVRRVSTACHWHYSDCSQGTSIVIRKRCEDVHGPRLAILAQRHFADTRSSKPSGNA